MTAHVPRDCGRCGRSFKNAFALGRHNGWCQKQLQAATEPAPVLASASTSAAELLVIDGPQELELEDVDDLKEPPPPKKKRKRQRRKRRASEIIDVEEEIELPNGCESSEKRTAAGPPPKKRRARRQDNDEDNERASRDQDEKERQRLRQASGPLPCPPYRFFARRGGSLGSAEVKWRSFHIATPIAGTSETARNWDRLVLACYGPERALPALNHDPSAYEGEEFYRRLFASPAPPAVGLHAGRAMSDADMRLQGFMAECGAFELEKVTSGTESRREQVRREQENVAAKGAAKTAPKAVQRPAPTRSKPAPAPASSREAGPAPSSSTGAPGPAPASSAAPPSAAFPSPAAGAPTAGGPPPFELMGSPAARFAVLGWRRAGRPDIFATLETPRSASESAVRRNWDRLAIACYGPQAAQLHQCCAVSSYQLEPFYQELFLAPYAPKVGVHDDDADPCRAAGRLSQFLHDCGALERDSGGAARPSGSGVPAHPFDFAERPRGGGRGCGSLRWRGRTLYTPMGDELSAARNWDRLALACYGPEAAGPILNFEASDYSGEEFFGRLFTGPPEVRERVGANDSHADDDAAACARLLAFMRSRAFVRDDAGAHAAVAAPASCRGSAAALF